MGRQMWTMNAVFFVALGKKASDAKTVRRRGSTMRAGRHLVRTERKAMSTRGAKAREDKIVEAILDNTTAVIYAKDLEGRYQLINRRFEELFGIAATEIKGQTDYDIFSKAMADKFFHNDQAVAQRNEQIEFEEIAPHDDGPHTYLSLKFPYRDEMGNCVGTCGISTDITPRKKIEAALRQSETRFRQLAENVPECFWITDTNTWQVLYVNSAFERIWGRSVAELYENSDTWIDAVHPADRQRVRETFFANAKTGAYEIEYRIIQPDGSVRWIADRGFPILNEDGQPYRVAGIAEDISQRRELERQVTAISSHERLRISHDLHDSLGQQLTGIGFLAKRLTNRLTATPDDQQTAADILSGVQEALAEVRRIVRGLAPVDFEGFGLDSALRELAASIGNCAGLDCIFDCPHPISIENNTVATELFRIAQEATNNAVKHANASEVTITIVADDRSLRLEVRDNGTGDPELKHTGGMGLRIMRHRSQVVGGKFEVDSSKNGTMVACTVSQEACRG